MSVSSVFERFWGLICTVYPDFGAQFLRIVHQSLGKLCILIPKNAQKPVISLKQEIIITGTWLGQSKLSTYDEELSLVSIRGFSPRDHHLSSRE